MPCFLQRALLVGGAIALIATSASTASADTDPRDAPRYEVSPTLATSPQSWPSDAKDSSAGPTDASPGRRFYGWQNMLVGYAGIGLMAASIKSGGALPYFGFGVYALGGPIVHIGHGEYGRAAGSLVINVLTPLLLGALAHSMDEDCVGRDHCGLESVTGALGGVVVGMIAAPLIDGLAMGWEDVKRPPPPEVSIQPTVSIARREANGASTTMLGLAGVF